MTVVDELQQELNDAADEYVPALPDFDEAKKRINDSRQSHRHRLEELGAIADELIAACPDDAMLAEWQQRLVAETCVNAQDVSSAINVALTRQKRAARKSRAQGKHRPAPSSPAGAHRRQADDVTAPPSEPVAVARDFLAKRFGGSPPRLAHWRGVFYICTWASWEERDDTAIRADLYEWLESCCYEVGGDNESGETKLAPWNPDKKKIAATFEALQAVAHLPEDVEDRTWIRYAGRWHADTPPLAASSMTIIPLANGLLMIPTGAAVTRGDATPAIVAPTPNYFVLSRLSIEYSKLHPTIASDASPRVTIHHPEWSKFLYSVWPDDPASIALLQEWYAYVLSGETRRHKMLLFVGPPRSGKGTIARILAALIGQRYTAAPTMASLVGPFGLQSLIGKTLATVADARFSGRDMATVVERLLSISGEDIQTVDRKFKSSWTGKLSVRFMLLSNELPKLSDVSGAIATRFLILETTHSFLGREDLELEPRLVQELPAILAWALDGLPRLQRQGRFTEPPSAREAAQVLMDFTSPMRAYAREKLIVGPTHEVGTDAAFTAWSDWCAANGRENVGTAQSFGRDIRAAIPGLRTGARGHGGSGGRVYIGFRLRTDRDPEPAPSDVPPDTAMSPETAAHTNGVAHGAPIEEGYIA